MFVFEEVLIIIILHSLLFLLTFILVFGILRQTALLCIEKECKVNSGMIRVFQFKLRTGKEAYR